MTLAPEHIASPDESLRCPLCEYDLRATTEARCPECGYAFTWDELRDPARRLHPYAFEHHPERNVTSFLQTFLAGLRPKRFWRTLFPTQPSRPGRLVLYWLIVCATCVVPLVIETARRWPVVEADMRGIRNRVMQTIIAGPENYESRKDYPTTQAYIDANWPPPTSGNILGMIFRYDSTSRMSVFALLSLVAWPWLTFVGLMIFQFSMRRARIKPRHVLRAVLYTSDVALWAAGAAMALLGYLVLSYGWVGSGMWGSGAPLDRVLIVTGIVFSLYTWRLAAAYRHYLRFPHAFATAFSVQFMILLLLAYVASESDVLRL